MQEKVFRLTEWVGGTWKNGFIFSDLLKWGSLTVCGPLVVSLQPSLENTVARKSINYFQMFFFKLLPETCIEVLFG